MNCRTAEDCFCTDEALLLHLRAAVAASAVCTRLLTLTVLMSGLVPSANDDGQRVAAVIAAGRLHVDHLVDADDLGFERLGDAGFDHLGGGARDSSQ